jgi:Tfp pilus assembly protein PilF
VNPAAYDAYLKGRLYFVNEFTKPDSLKKAQHYFEESLQEDPNFALAYAGLAALTSTWRMQELCKRTRPINQPRKR